MGSGPTQQVFGISVESAERFGVGAVAIQAVQIIGIGLPSDSAVGGAVLLAGSVVSGDSRYFTVRYVIGRVQVSEMKRHTVFVYTEMGRSMTVIQLDYKIRQAESGGTP